MNSQNTQISQNVEAKFNGNDGSITSSPSVNKITPSKLDKRNHSPAESESSGVSSGYGDGGSPQLHSSNQSSNNGNEENTLLGLMVCSKSVIFLEYVFLVPSLFNNSFTQNNLSIACRMQQNYQQNIQSAYPQNYPQYVNDVPSNYGVNHQYVGITRIVLDLRISYCLYTGKLCTPKTSDGFQFEPLCSEISKQYESQ